MLRIHTRTSCRSPEPSRSNRRAPGPSAASEGANPSADSQGMCSWERESFTRIVPTDRAWAALRGFWTGAEAKLAEWIAEVGAELLALRLGKFGFLFFVLGELFFGVNVGIA